MPHRPNPKIGTCPCPMAGCSIVCDVKQFKNTATVDGQRRNAGKLYIDCSEHGRFGFDGKAAMQEYILEHATIDGQAPRARAPATLPAAPPERSSSAPAALPAPSSSAAGGAPGSASAAAPSAPERSRRPFTLLG